MKTTKTDNRMADSEDNFPRAPLGMEPSRKTAGASGTGKFLCLALALALAGVGCAFQSGTRAPTISARGPGQVFPTIEAAAYDALAYSHLLSKETRAPSRSLGGSIYRIDGGFSYEQPSQASLIQPHVVPYQLKATDVGHFHTYPKHPDHTINRIRDKISAPDRHVVDRQDPLHRPSYFLTPKLQIKVYRGRDSGTEYLAKLGDWEITDSVVVATTFSPGNQIAVTPKGKSNTAR